MFNPPQILKNPRMPVVLVAGGAGFIGFYLTDYLLSQGFRVVVVDSLRNNKKNILADLTSHPRFAFFQADLNQGLPAKMEGVDYIINLAGEEIHLFDDDDGSDSLITNALANRNLLELAKKSSAKVLIASSINVYQGSASSTSLKNYFGKTDEEARLFSFSEAKRFAESLAFEYRKKYNLDVRIARLGEVYGPKMNLKTTSSLGRFVESVLKGESLTIYGDGLEREYYCYISDTIDGLVKTLFRDETAGTIFPITDLSPVTTLELAYLVKSLSPLGTQIIFKPRFDDLEIPSFKVVDGKAQRELKWKPKINLRDGVKLTLDSFGLEKSKAPAQSEVVQLQAKAVAENAIPPGRYKVSTRKTPHFELPKIDFSFIRKLRPNVSYRKDLARLFLFGLTGLSLVLTVPAGQALYHFTAVWVSLRKIEVGLKNLEIDKVSENLRQLSGHFDQVRGTLEWLPILSRQDRLKIISSLSLANQAAAYAAEGLEPLSQSLLRLASDQSQGASEVESINRAYLSTAGSLANASDLAGLAYTEMKGINTRGLPPFISEKISAYDKLLVWGEENLRKLGFISKIAPRALGLESTKSYLLIFQNSNEIRPTGGFIGSLGKIKIRNGRFEETKIFDVYDIDGQIDEQQIKIDQPKFLSDNLKTEVLHLRDANYSPDFPESAQRIRNIYSRITDEVVDGVISIDLATIEGLLKVTGPVFLPVYNETISSENVFERTQFHAEASYFPGSSQKKTFLSSLSQQLLDSVFSLERKKYITLLKELEALLKNKHLLAYFPEEQSSISELSWDGRVLSTNDDYLFVVDTNVGSNKSNYFIERLIEYHLEKDNRQGEYLAELSINYKHKGTSNAWPGGPYKNYLRVYVPKKTALLKVTRQKDGSTARTENLLEKTEIGEEFGKTSFALTFGLEPNQETTLNFSYMLPRGISPSAENPYQLIIQKQPGTKEERFSFSFKLPLGLGPAVINDSQFSVTDNSVNWEGQLESDKTIEIPLKSK